MAEIRFTLISDGSSDRALIPLLAWCLRQQAPACAIQPAWADLQRLPDPPRDLDRRILKSIEYYPCDLLFIHRDAENQTVDRHQEIEQAISTLGTAFTTTFVCVVPVRMTEAWFLFDEKAIRLAAGSPRGTECFRLPSLSSVEDIADPKQLLHESLRIASGLRGRRWKKFNVHSAIHRLADSIEDFSPLHRVPAFACMYEKISEAVRQLGIRAIT